MKIRFHNEDDGWTTDGPTITSTESLNAIRRCLEDVGPVVVEHRFYRGSCAPDRMIFNDVAGFNTYLETHAHAGDAFHVWSFAIVCRDDNQLTFGKCPDENGRVPKRGAY